MNIYLHLLGMLGIAGIGIAGIAALTRWWKYNWPEWLLVWLLIVWMAHICVAGFAVWVLCGIK